MDGSLGSTDYSDLLSGELRHLAHTQRCPHLDVLIAAELHSQGRIQLLEQLKSVQKGTNHFSQILPTVE